MERSDGPPLVVPVWYAYEPGGEVEVEPGRHFDRRPVDGMNHVALFNAGAFRRHAVEHGGRLEAMFARIEYDADAAHRA